MRLTVNEVLDNRKRLIIDNTAKDYTADLPPAESFLKSYAELGGKSSD